jgi:response regulator NasT
MILDNVQPNNKPLKQSLIDNGFDVIARINEDVDLQTKCSEIKADVVIIEVASPNQDILDNVSKISDQCAIPVIMFTNDSNKEKIKAATSAGASAYVVGSIPSERLTSVIDAAIARFEETKQLKEELDLVSDKLDERKVVERAKGILMKQRNIDENEAYKMLRSMAMQRNKKIADVSTQLLQAATMLIV